MVSKPLDNFLLIAVSALALAGGLRPALAEIPADGGDGRTVMDRIRKERQIELAFEGHRYFDVRRWMIAPEVYTGWNTGIRIHGPDAPAGEPRCTSNRLHGAPCPNTIAR